MFYLGDQWETLPELFGKVLEGELLCAEVAGTFGSWYENHRRAKQTEKGGSRTARQVFTASQESWALCEVPLLNCPHPESIKSSS